MAMLVTPPQLPFTPEAAVLPIARADRSGNYAVASLPARPDSGTAARAMVRQALEDWGLYRSVADVELVVAELVANAVTHGTRGRSAGTTVVVEARRRGRSLRVAVTDDRPDVAPVMRAAGVEEESGRGLRLVDDVSSAWGWEPVSRGRCKQVWAEFEFDTSS
ncbi:ATP-binding protein [Streptomyces hainanensis]|uniref:ATP-binding protein n=1 Tax=Streptomyces hainanensis TaxID=402648 RepID=A0A4V6PBV5_9ACTN|nr:ATP-binding protein [Streptomyces hainanensis]TDC77505.1 ATP-binding protein [Streptomyces hainanensis]